MYNCCSQFHMKYNQNYYMFPLKPLSPLLKLSKTLTNSRSGPFTVNCSPGQYIFFAIPTRFGTPKFTVGGFEGGFNLISTIDFTNSSNYTEPYYLYKSENHSLGNTTVNVG